MVDRVLSTEQARTSIASLKNLIESDFVDQIARFDSEGQTLSDPNVWDGQLAEQFRNNDWPQVHRTLNQLKEQMAELRAQIDTINNNIMTAGGN